MDTFADVCMWAYAVYATVSSPPTASLIIYRMTH